MNLIAMRSTSTSAGGAMQRIVPPALVSLLLVSLNPATSSAFSGPLEPRISRSVLQTTAGAPVVVEARAGAALAELRRLTGFTWDQLARMFAVSKRSLHFWASGKPISPSHEERLHRALATVRKLDRGSACENRAALLTARADGQIPYDLLANEQYERLTSLLGHGNPQARKKPAPLSAAAQAARTPLLRPEQLVGALEDAVHIEPGRLLATKAIRVTRGK